MATQEVTHYLGRNQEYHPLPRGGFRGSIVHGSTKTKQFQKACSKWKKKDEADRATEAQAKEDFKDMHEVFDEQCDSLHDIGVANNVKMKESIAKLTADNAQMKLEMATQNAKNERYQMVANQEQ